MYHQISIKGLTILKKIYIQLRTTNMTGLSRMFVEHEGHVSSNFYQGSNNTKKKSTYQNVPHIRISYITVFQNKSNILESRFSANDHMISSD